MVEDRVVTAHDLVHENIKFSKLGNMHFMLC